MEERSHAHNVNIVNKVMFTNVHYATADTKTIVLIFRSRVVFIYRVGSFFILFIFFLSLLRRWRSYNYNIS